MEGLLKQILEGQNKLLNEVQGIKGEVQGIKDEVQDIKGEMQSVKDEVKNLSERVENLEGQTRENTDIIKAIRHTTEVIHAKVDGLAATTASKEAIADLDAKFDVLNQRLFQQEADLQRLKKAQ